MKRFLSFCLSAVMLLSLTVTAGAASLPALTFDISCEGAAYSGGENKITKVEPGTVITVSYKISAAQDTAFGAMQDHLCFDPTFFELVPGSVSLNSALSGDQFKCSEHSGAIYFSTIYGMNCTTEAKEAVTFQLKVIGTAGQSAVTNQEAMAFLPKSSDEFPITTRDLTVRVTDNFQVVFKNGDTTVSTLSVREGGSVTLPAAAVKQYHTFQYWKLDGDNTHYAPGSSYTPQSNVTFTAVFAEVPKPAKPTGITGLKTSAPNVNDGSLIGTTTAMEYSTNADFTGAKACSEGKTVGLAAGTYYVRVRANGNTPPGESATVSIPEGQIPAAPTGLTAVKTSAPGAKDGKILGTTTAMEWSTTQDFSAATACTGSQITDLTSGAYYVRLKAVSATNTCAGAIAVITVPEGQIPDAPTGLTAVKTSAPGAKDGKILGTTTAMEWSDTQDFSKPTACTGSEITGLAAGTYYVRFKAVPASNTVASNYIALLIVDSQPAGGGGGAGTPSVNAPTGLRASDASDIKTADGKISGTTSKMEWSLSPDFAEAHICGDWETSGLAAGTYYVRYRADPAANKPASGYTTVEIGMVMKPEIYDWFTDVSPDAYYADAVLWAVENDITNGVSPMIFAPDNSCTRAQVVTFLWRAAGCPKSTAVDNPFTDVKQGEYYYDAVLWAAENGVTNGTTATTFGTDGTVTRAQFVTFLFRSQKAAATGKAAAFSDVPAGAYYADAVAWAAETGVTNGITATAFGPENACNRGQVVTFLYRCFVK